MAGTPNYPKSLPDVFSSLKNSLAETRTVVNTRQAMSVVKSAALTFLGDLIVDAGGRLLVRYSPEVVALAAGKSRFEETRVGWWFYRPEGQVLMSVYQNADGGGYFGIYDKNGNLMFSEDDVSGYGIASPFMGYNVPTPADPASITRVWGQTASTTFETIGHSYIRIYHPRLSVLGVTTTAGTGVTGEWALFVNGTQASSTWTGSFNESFSIPGWGSTVHPGDQLSIEFKARVSSTATGTVYGQIQGFDGLGSA